MRLSARSSHRALLAMLLGSILLVYIVLRPLGVALFLAAVLAVAFWPLHARLSRALGGRERLAATLLLVLVLVAVLGPIFTLSAFMVKEAAEALDFVSNTVRSQGVEGLVARMPDWMQDAAHKVLERVPQGDQELSKTVQQQVSAQGGTAASAVGSAVVATGSLLFQGAMMLIGLYFFLTEKERIIHWVDEASPLRRGQTRELLTEFRRVTVAVVRSTVLTALAQAVAALIGYFIARVPAPLFFGAITFVFAMIPAIGGASVCLVAALLLLLTGHTVSAAFLAGWGVIVVGLSDNVVKPLIIKGGVEMHGAVVFFALLGGLAACGAIGLVLGPLAVALFIALLRIYRRDYGDGGTLPSPAPPGSAPAPSSSSPSTPGRLVPREV
jgi:predicted PurR-regulated permease PerM